MMRPQSVELTPVEASAQIQRQLVDAHRAFEKEDLESALDYLTSGLGLGLQIGPAATEKALWAVIAVARELTRQDDAAGLSLLGPALAGLVQQVREADVLSQSGVMSAWAQFVSDLGALIGQLGLALTITGLHRADMMENARARAVLLDDATDNLFALTRWLDQARLNSQEQ